MIIKLLETILIMPLVLVGGLIAGVLYALVTTLVLPAKLIVDAFNDIWED